MCEEKDWGLGSSSHSSDSQTDTFYFPFSLGKGTGKALDPRGDEIQRPYTLLARPSEHRTRELGAGDRGQDWNSGSVGF